MQATLHFTQPPATSASAAEPALTKGKLGNRLTKEGYAILEAYIRDHPDEHFPDLGARKHLLDRLHGLPGLENYALHNLNGWFKRRLQKKQSLPVSTLKKETINQLVILCQGQPNPPPDVIKVWSQLLHISQEEIVAYLKSQFIEDYEEHSYPPNHLPTPVSTSPEPYYDNIPYKADPTHSPRVPPHQHERIPQYEHPLSRKSLILAVAEAASRPEPINKPTTPKEFNEMFAQYGKMMENFIQKNEEYLRYHSPSS